MRDANCVFCKIASGETSSYEIYEDKDYVAFLDIFPVAKGQTLVIPKNHSTSVFSDAGDEELAGLILVAKKVANLLRKKLHSERVNLAFQGQEVSHLHAKLYPDYGITSMGPKASDSDLRNIHKQITE